jgi:hypothetical protein
MQFSDWLNEADTIFTNAFGNEVKAKPPAPKPPPAKTYTHIEGAIQQISGLPKGYAQKPPN